MTDDVDTTELEALLLKLRSRQTLGAILRPEAPASQDPLAELAKLIGACDPFAAELDFMRAVRSDAAALVCDSAYCRARGELCLLCGYRPIIFRDALFYRGFSFNSMPLYDPVSLPGWEEPMLLPERPSELEQMNIIGPRD